MNQSRYQISQYYDYNNNSNLLQPTWVALSIANDKMMHAYYDIGVFQLDTVIETRDILFM